MIPHLKYLREADHKTKTELLIKNESWCYFKFNIKNKQQIAARRVFIQCLYFYAIGLASIENIVVLIILFDEVS